MTQVTITDSDGLPIPAVIFKADLPVASVNDKGIVNLAEGDYVAQVIGFVNEPFSVTGTGTKTIAMKFKDVELGGVEIVADRIIKKKSSNPWVVFVVSSGLLGGLIYLLSIK